MIELFIAVLLAMLLLVIAIARPIVRDGLFIGQMHNDKLVHRNCNDCDGCGVVMIGGQILHPDHRTFVNTSEGLVFRGRIANTTTCLSCNGMGRVWVDANNEVRKVIQDRRMNDNWQM